MFEIVLTVIFLLLIAISLYDIKCMRIPLYLNIPLLLSSLLYSYFQKTDLLNLFIYTAAGFLFFVIIRLITKNGLGLGDAILSSSIASMLGIWFWLLAMTAASLLALIYILVIKSIKKTELKNKRIPFAPFISAGASFFLIYHYLIN